MNRRAKKDLIRILFSAICLTFAILSPINGWFRSIVFLLPYLLVGYDILWKALRNIVHGRIFDENFLMILATAGAFAIGEYPEAVFVMLFYQIGEWFQRLAVGKSRRSIASLMEIRPDYANIMKNGNLIQVEPEQVSVGDRIIVHPGEKVPLDGIIIEGSASLSTMALTGESVPVDLQKGDSVLSGSVNLNGVLTIEVTKPFAQSTVVKILELVESATQNKAKSEQFISKFARYYTPIVVGAALLLAIFPPLVMGGGWIDWLHRALIFLVVSCPCALVISVPLSFFGGIGGASRQGILIKGANHIETLAKAKTVVFDKTGTLTNGTFTVTDIVSQTMQSDELLQLAASLEQFSSHPIGKAICKTATNILPRGAILQIEEISGKGLTALINGQKIYAGNERLMEQQGISVNHEHQAGTCVHLCADHVYLGYITLSDAIKPQSEQAIQQLRALGIAKTVMLTGDRNKIACQVADCLQLDEFYAQLLPNDKVTLMERFTDQPHNCSVVFVGDGINDAPVLARADLGIAMGGVGSDAAIEAADVVLMDDNPLGIPKAIRTARRTLAIVKQNIWLALSIKLLVLILAAFGHAFMWQAVFADVGVSVIAIMNAMRALKT